MAILLTWPDVPWETIEYGLYGLVLVLPVLTYPFSRFLWLAVDLAFRPPAPPDLSEPSQRSRP